ncbi:MAG: endo alpha-1,4 polygalactosaminidase [Polyangiales bacterium]
MIRSRCFVLGLLLACGDSDKDPVDAAVPADAARAVDAVVDAQVSRSDAAASDAVASDAAGDMPGLVRLPPANGGLDYQLGGAYAPPQGVTIVARDRTAQPAPGLYNVCYVNGFQAQESEADMWLAQDPELVLRDSGGEPVIDRDWNEMLLDIGSPQKRAQLAEIVGGWIAGCASAGFDAVEIDNLDSYTRSGGRLLEEDAVQFLALLSMRAHAEGLAIGQKNASELAGRRRELGTDFAVSEECARYDECEAYITAYGAAVLMVEYRRGDFQKGCGAHPDFSIVLRDLDLVTPGSSGYVFEGC